jgi:molecular chaperone DnaK (HSP70)
MAVTSEFLGHSQVKKAVMAVPAKFTSIQREATASAFKAAGLKVVRVIEEPTAAAVAYKLHKKSNIKHILVYDFGGGTLDVSILYVSRGSVQVYATDGDDMLGGSDLDFCLDKHLTHKVEAVSKESMHTEPPPKETVDAAHIPVDQYCTGANIRSMAESIKKQLSSIDTTTFRCVDPVEDGHKKIEFEITRHDFESQCSHLFERALVPVTRLLSELGELHQIQGRE